MVLSGVRDVTLMTNICSQLAEFLYATFCNTMSRNVMQKKPNWDSISKVKVTVWADIIKI